MSGDQCAITNFSGVQNTTDNFICTIQTDDFSLWDVVGRGFTGMLPTEPTTPEVITIRLTDGPTKPGRSRKVLPVEIGLLFPKLMSRSPVMRKYTMPQSPLAIQ